MIDPSQPLPIRIREDWVIWLAGIPWNLTEEEAAKIAAVVMAMVKK